MLEFDFSQKSNWTVYAFKYTEEVLQHPECPIDLIQYILTVKPELLEYAIENATNSNLLGLIGCVTSKMLKSLGYKLQRKVKRVFLEDAVKELRLISKESGAFSLGNNSIVSFYDAGYAIVTKAKLHKALTIDECEQLPLYRSNEYSGLGSAQSCTGQSYKDNDRLADNTGYKTYWSIVPNSKTYATLVSQIDIPHLSNTDSLYCDNLMQADILSAIMEDTIDLSKALLGITSRALMYVVQKNHIAITCDTEALGAYLDHESGKLMIF